MPSQSLLRTKDVTSIKIMVYIYISSGYVARFFYKAWIKEKEKIKISITHNLTTQR